MGKFIFPKMMKICILKMQKLGKIMNAGNEKRELKGQKE